MKYYSLLFILFLTACNLLPLAEKAANEPLQVESPTKAKPSSHIVSYYDAPLPNNVNDYVKWLIQDLFTSLDMPNNDEVFIITDLAILGSDLNKTTLFGRQISEAMLHEVHQTGFSTIDFRTTDFVRISEAGDIFSQTRDFLDLSNSIDAANVITGTLTKHRGGYLLNARAIEMSSKILIGTAQIFVPYDVVDSIIEESTTHNTQNIKDMGNETIHNSLNMDSSMEKKGIPVKEYNAGTK